MSRLYGMKITGRKEKEYYVTAGDISSSPSAVKVTKEVYEALLEMQREYWRQSKNDAKYQSLLGVFYDDKLPECLVEQSPEEILLARIHTENLKKALLQLPKKQLKRFLLHDMLGVTIEQIAKNDCCSKRAVDTSLAKARKRIKKIMQKGFV